MQDLNDLYYFVQIVDHGGFAPAGRALGVPKSKLSRRISKLEKSLGVLLIQRSTRNSSVTNIGQTYYEHCKAMLIEAEAAQESIDLTRAEPCGIVRVTCPITLLSVSVNKMLADFQIKYPRVHIHLEATDRRVDLISETIDVALRVRPLPFENSDLVMRILANATQYIVASPNLLNKDRLPKIPADLTNLPSLGLGKSHHKFEWILYGPNSVEEKIEHHPKYITRDMVALRSAAVAGVGITHLPEIVVREELTKGMLVKLIPDWNPKPDTIHLVFPSRRGMLPSVRALIDFLATEFETLNDY